MYAPSSARPRLDMAAPSRPSTGKTHTLIELILQFLKQGLRILVCAPSNVAVDNVAERLAPHSGAPIVRIGHPARLLPSVAAHSLDVLTQTSEAGAIVRDVRAEMDAKQGSIKKTKSARERRLIYADLKELRKEFRERERRCVTDLVRSSKVVLATLHGAGGFQLRQEKFDVVIIDEASQALEAQCWVALFAAKKAVCAGDHLQLPPTIKSLNSKTPTAAGGAAPAAAKGKGRGATLETTLFDRLLKLHGASIKRMLTTQYRMHEKIMRFPSDELYGSELTAAEAVKGRLLRDLPYAVEDTDETREPLIFIDTQGGNFSERSDDTEAGDAAGKKKIALHGESKSNEREAALVSQQVRLLVDAGVKPEDIAVVTPYNGQVRVSTMALCSPVLVSPCLVPIPCPFCAGSCVSAFPRTSQPGCWHSPVTSIILIPPPLLSFLYVLGLLFASCITFHPLLISFWSVLCGSPSHGRSSVPAFNQSSGRNCREPPKKTRVSQCITGRGIAVHAASGFLLTKGWGDCQTPSLFSDNQLAVLAPLLKEAFPGIELGSVDGFQGREKEAVIVSLVRSNSEGEVGFLGEKRRLNVAMTRPKRSLTIIGDSDTVKRGSAFLKRWMEHLEEHADLRYPEV
ncbi:DNA helicase, variant [Gaeumannomyces tritici R3-111a-1]|uniref:DNA helicase, variant n=1 Tax=Gaeumannomyces tritici (strain R3-111a-1) TaxID=644352 RepID=J3NJJ4_GAET3|nr:DNA helicase, variant [Gaeumannomyces tritici R3-111a-1]EJT81445.1 DNA helicase, variant [Gaeumannomyces tritici R3-111a-1]